MDVYFQSPLQVPSSPAADRSIIRPPVTEAHVVLNNTHRQLALR